jgi:hypothetical protein
MNKVIEKKKEESKSEKEEDEVKTLKELVKVVKSDWVRKTVRKVYIWHS